MSSKSTLDDLLAYFDRCDRNSEGNGFNHCPIFLKILCILGLIIGFNVQNLMYFGPNQFSKFDWYRALAEAELSYCSG